MKLVVLLGVLLIGAECLSKDKSMPAGSLTLDWNELVLSQPTQVAQAEDPSSESRRRAEIYWEDEDGGGMASNRAKLRVGVSAGFDGVLGLVPYDSSTSSGLGGGAALNFYVFTLKRLLFTIGLGYRILSLGRSFDNSGVIEEPTPAEFTQTQRFLTGSFTVAYLLNPNQNVAENMQWWLEGGGEYLLGVSSSQSTNFGVESTLSSDNLLLLVLGPAGSQPLSRSLYLAGGLYAYYNILAKEGSRLFGGRLKLALQVAL